MHFLYIGNLVNEFENIPNPYLPSSQDFQRICGICEPKLGGQVGGDGDCAFCEVGCVRENRFCGGLAHDEFCGISEGGEHRENGSGASDYSFDEGAACGVAFAFLEVHEAGAEVLRALGAHDRF